MLYSYTTYGLAISSYLSIPEFSSSTGGDADVRISMGSLESPPTVDQYGTYFDVTSQKAFLYWKQVGGFLVQNGNEIVIDPIPGVEERAIRLPLLGATLASLLHQRGFLVLHGSAVAIGGEAAVFVGGKKQGKSTMAAALYQRGHTLIADDVVAIRIGETGEAMVVPGFPQMKLWPETAAYVLGDDPEKLPNIITGYEKRSRQIADRFSSEWRPLKAIFSLSEGSHPLVRRLEPQEAIAQLVCHSYMARFGQQLLKGNEAVIHLNQCAALVRQNLVYRLERPKTLALLSKSAELVEDQLETISDLVPA